MIAATWCSSATGSATPRSLLLASAAALAFLTLRADAPPPSHAQTSSERLHLPLLLADAQAGRSAAPTRAVVTATAPAPATGTREPTPAPSPTATGEGWRPVRVFGQVDLRETAYNEIHPDRMFQPGGVVIDRMPAPTPSRIYVWDSGNNRVLGLRHFGRCMGGAREGEPCTENSGCPAGACTDGAGRAADLVLGQLSGLGHGACNRDNTLAAPAAADRLCAVPFPHQISVTEGMRGNSMAVDAAHALYLVDPYNNRVLRFDDPLDDPMDPHAGHADAVWGQPDFVSRDCNQGRSAPGPDTLCTGEIDRLYPNHYFSAGLDVASDGSNLWVADLGNHRILRFSEGASRADLVIGQPDFTSGAHGCRPGASLDRLCKPNSVRHDPTSGRLYVLDGDGEQARVLVFEPPLRSGMAASFLLPPPPGGFFWARGLVLDPTIPGALWVTDTERVRFVQYVDDRPTRLVGKGAWDRFGCIGAPGDGPLDPFICSPNGSPGLDRDGSLYAAGVVWPRLLRYPAPLPLPRPDGRARSPDAWILGDARPSMRYANRVGPGGLANPGQIALAGDQLVVLDRKRIVFWNDAGATEGPESAGPADGVLVQADAGSQEGHRFGVDAHDFVGVAHDALRGRLYATHGNGIYVFDSSDGLTDGEPPLEHIAATLTRRGGGTLSIFAWGIALDEAADTAWLVDAEGHRLLRVLRWSRGDREVDLVIGQSGPERLCNRGRGREHPVADGLCRPTQVRIDGRGDLYVVDATWEGGGNQRVLAWRAEDLPPIPAPRLFLPDDTLPAARVYGKPDFSSVDCHPDRDRHPCTPRGIAFEPETNRLLMTVDGYGNALGRRIFLYGDPAPAGEVAVEPSGVIGLPAAQPADATWLGPGRVIVLDHTWNRAVLLEE